MYRSVTAHGENQTAEISATRYATIKCVGLGWAELILRIFDCKTDNVCGLSDVTVTREDSASDEQDADQV